MPRVRFRIRTLMIAVAMVVLPVGLEASRGAPPEDEDLTRLLDALTRQMTAWDSIEFRVRIDQIEGRGQASWLIREYHYIETKEGRRFRDMLGLGTTGGFHHTSLFATGERFASLTYSAQDPEVQEQFVVSAGFGMEDPRFVTKMTERPEPLFRLYPGMVPLHEILRKAKPTGPSTVMGRETEGFLALASYTQQPRQLAVQLDRATGIPLRIAFGDDAANPMWVWEVKAIAEDHGFHFPVSVLLRSLTSGSEEVIIVTEVHFNKEFPVEVFWPVLQFGVTVLGDGPTYRVGEVKTDEPGAK